MRNKRHVVGLISVLVVLDARLRKDVVVKQNHATVVVHAKLKKSHVVVST